MDSGRDVESQNRDEQSDEPKRRIGCFLNINIFWPPLGYRWRYAHAMDVETAIQTLIRYDFEPPYEEYDPSEFAESLVECIPAEQHQPFIRDVLRRLPSSMASTVLDVFLDSVPCSADLLFDEIASGHSLDTAATIVELIVKKMQTTPDEIASRLTDTIRICNQQSLQDRYAFGLWVIFCGEKLLIPENESVGFLVSDYSDNIRNLLCLNGLSDFTRSTLSRCLDVS